MERGTLDIVSSPLARARETSAVYEEQAGGRARIDGAFGEIPTPPEVPDRQAWLRSIMASSWPEQEAVLKDWRREALQALAALSRPTVVFTHFVLINTVLGALEGSDDLIGWMPANCSIHHLRGGPGGIAVHRVGEQLETTIN